MDSEPGQSSPLACSYDQSSIYFRLRRTPHPELSVVDEAVAGGNYVDFLSVGSGLFA